jgi:uncharacterized SAM-binding protein YcdF (DUF218 family)
VFALELALAAFVVSVAGVLRDPRRFSNAVFLGLALALGALGCVERLARAPERSAHLLLLVVVLLVAAGPFVAAIYLIVNGVTVTIREGVRPVNLLPLLTGLAIVVVMGLVVAADRAGSAQLSLFTTITVLLSGYLSFLCVSYVIYAFLYGRLAFAGDAQFVVVLGAGLKDGGQVPPLLASRLERGRSVYETLAAHSVADHSAADHGAADHSAADHGAAGPVLIVSGGKGSDERVPEAEAMAEYLTSRGFPASRIVLEDRSRTTEENLVYSKAIMDQRRPGSRCVIVTSSFHAFRAAIIARRLGIDGQVTGAPTAAYYWPGAMLREFAAVLLSYKIVNFGVCVLIVAAPLAYTAVRGGL